MIEIAADGLAAARDLDLGVEPVDALHELGGGPGVQALAIDDLACRGTSAPGNSGGGGQSLLVAIQVSLIFRPAPCWRR